MRRNYGFCRTIPLSHDETVSAVTAALDREGFGIVSELDVKALLHDGDDNSAPAYTILGACNRDLARQALQLEPELGLLLLPCDVVVIDNGDGASTLGIVDPVQALEPADNPGLQAIVDQLNRLLYRAYLNVVLDAESRAAGLSATWYGQGLRH